jgi:hypothetical protein
VLLDVVRGADSHPHFAIRTGPCGLVGESLQGIREVGGGASGFIREAFSPTQPRQRCPQSPVGRAGSVGRLRDLTETARALWMVRGARYAAVSQAKPSRSVKVSAVLPRMMRCEPLLRHARRHPLPSPHRGPYPQHRHGRPPYPPPGAEGPGRLVDQLSEAGGEGAQRCAFTSRSSASTSDAGQCCVAFAQHTSRARCASTSSSWKARNNTMFVVAEYLGWVEILRRGIQFLDLGSEADNRAVVTCVGFAPRQPPRAHPGHHPATPRRRPDWSRPAPGRRRSVHSD